MSILNKYTKNRALLEGCMVQGYSTEEVVDWCIDFFDPKNPIGIPKSRHEGRLAGRGTIGEKIYSRADCIQSSSFSCVTAHS
jgi:hypothetical protein